MSTFLLFWTCLSLALQYFRVVSSVRLCACAQQLPAVPCCLIHTCVCVCTTGACCAVLSYPYVRLCACVQQLPAVPWFLMHTSVCMCTTGACCAWSTSRGSGALQLLASSAPCSPSCTASSTARHVVLFPAPPCMLCCGLHRTCCTPASLRVYLFQAFFMLEHRDEIGVGERVVVGDRTYKLPTCVEPPNSHTQGRVP
jgi:hypothetical protein